MTNEVHPYPVSAGDSSTSASFDMLMSALGDSTRANCAESASAHTSGEWWAQKKRKRAISCGQCDACCREDCGNCLNCLDKPKFGGQGIRKQSCLSRKCLNSTPVGASNLGAAAASSSAAKARPDSEMPQVNSPSGMSATEMRDFWGAVQCCMQLADNSGAQTKPVISMEGLEERLGGSKRPRPATTRTARCGSCAGCMRGDCGDCKNCLDKPKYGGRGIKKQACLRRACLATEMEHEFDEDELTRNSDAVAATRLSEGGFLSQDASPALKPFTAADIPAFKSQLPPAAGKHAHLQPPMQQLEAQDKPGTAYSTADEEEASEDAAQALVMASRHKVLCHSASLLSSRRKVATDQQLNEPFEIMLGAAAAMPNMMTV